MALKLPQGLKEHYSRLTKWDELERCLGTPLRKSIRINTLLKPIKEVIDSISKEWTLTQIPWCKEGFFIKDKEGKRKDIGNIAGHNEGFFYVQEAASMIPAIVLGPKPGESVLDMCASPGGKTTQMAQMMINTGRIVAADIREDRIAILKRNVERMGAENCEIVKKPGQQFKDVKFDKILVDAPCSGTGTMRTQEEIDKFEPEIAKRLCFEQRSLLHSAYCVLKKGGVMAYSTCSLEPEENEAVIDWLLKRHKKTELEEIKIEGIKRSEPIMEYDGVKFDERVKKCLRLWPQDNDTAGFFVAKIRKAQR